MPILIEGFVGIVIFLALIYAIANLINGLFGKTNAPKPEKKNHLEKDLVAGLAAEDIPEGKCEFSAKISICTQKEDGEIRYKITLVPNSTRRL